MKTVLIRGCDELFGPDIALFFLQQNWRVIATMRFPTSGVMPVSENFSLLPLDHTDQQNIDLILQLSEPVDVLINCIDANRDISNGYTARQLYRNAIDSKIMGTLAMTWAITPYFQKRKKGMIINVAEKLSETIKTINKSHSSSLKQDNIKVCLISFGQGIAQINRNMDPLNNLVKAIWQEVCSPSGEEIILV